MQAERLKILLDFLAEDPTDPFNRYALAMEYLRSDPARTIEHLEILISEHPNYLPSYYQLGHLYTETVNYKAAETVLSKGIQLAKKQKNEKTEKELRGAYQLLMDEQQEW